MAGERTCYRVDHVCGSRPNQLARVQTHGPYCATTNSGVEGQSGGWKVSQAPTNAKRDFFMVVVRPTTNFPPNSLANLIARVCHLFSVLQPLLTFWVGLQFFIMAAISRSPT